MDTRERVTGYGKPTAGPKASSTYSENAMEGQEHGRDWVLSVVGEKVCFIERAGKTGSWGCSAGERKQKNEEREGRRKEWNGK